jgi:hypothetical protein
MECYLVEPRVTFNFTSMYNCNSHINTVHAFLGPTQPPIKWVPGTLTPGVKQLGHEAEHSPPSSAKVKNAWSCTSTPLLHLHGMVFN